MFDATALQAIADELKEKVLHGRVQEIMQLDALTFGFEIYAGHTRHYLYVSAHPEDARVHLASQKLRGSGEAPSAFLLLLRKYAEGAFVDSIAPLPHERVLRIAFDHSVEGISTLVVETIGRYSNIILLDADDVVVDSVKRVGAQVNRARVTLPKHKYAPPPAQDKLDPSTLEPAKLARALLDQ
ncbi:MAG: NFACT family protein, partial [Acidobacteriota bacterium]